MTDQQLMELAKLRAGFKRSLISYLLVISFLWSIYLITDHHSRIPWPLWVMLGWGIDLIRKYLEAYKQQNWFSAEKEFDKLKNNNN